MRLKVNMCLQLNIDAPEVNCTIFEIGAPAVLDYLSKCGVLRLGFLGVLVFFFYYKRMHQKA